MNLIKLAESKGIKLDEKTKLIQSRCFNFLNHCDFFDPIDPKKREEGEIQADLFACKNNKIKKGLLSVFRKFKANEVLKTQKAFLLSKNNSFPLIEHLEQAMPSHLKSSISNCQKKLKIYFEFLQLYYIRIKDIHPTPQERISILEKEDKKNSLA